MTEAFSDLRDALKERLRVIADPDLRERDPQAHLNELKEAASRLDAAIGRLPEHVDPDLRHFLQRQSYVKALAWLEGQD